MPQSRRSCCPIRRNLLAMLVMGGVVGIAQINFDPMCVGASPQDRGVPFAPPMMDLPPVVPAPELKQTSNQNEVSSDPQELEPASDPHILRGIWALKMASHTIATGVKGFENVSNYTATMFKQERVGGLLSEGQSIELKLRHEPFSVYMKWLTGDSGRQLIYVDGLNDGNLLVQPGGIRGRLTGVLSLDPTGSMAMSESRHPVTKIGILGLAKTILSYQKKDLERAEGFRCELHDNQKFNDRDCYLFNCEYDSEEANPDYRKSTMFIDKELGMPVCVKNFCWGRDVNPETIDEETLVEFYAYDDIQFERELTAADFDQNNRSYRLRVRR
ncbi:MAG: DUF1571 domain-containing protein [Planctomycetaceae bacterium]|nr:DUF1571 domain-containing protein [Planctomycetaceae bacterium]